MSIFSSSMKRLVIKHFLANFYEEHYTALHQAAEKRDSPNAELLILLQMPMSVKDNLF